MSLNTAFAHFVIDKSIYRFSQVHHLIGDFRELTRKYYKKRSNRFVNVFRLEILNLCVHKPAYVMLADIITVQTIELVASNISMYTELTPKIRFFHAIIDTYFVRYHTMMRQDVQLFVFQILSYGKACYQYHSCLC